MDLLEQTKKLCKLYNIKPARSRGQNFLIEEKVYDDIIAAADLQPDDVVLEVGTGLGFLTAKLAAQAKKVIAVELDDKLAEVLKIALAAKGIKNVEVVNEDILKTQPAKENYKIVANLPYNITSIFLRRFLEVENKPKLMVLMLQKEVAQRITAQAGKMSLLAVSVQLYGLPEIVQIVPAKNFWPQPEVDSAIIKIEARSKKFEVNDKEFFRLVKFGFIAKRKMLKNNLAAGLRLDIKLVENKLVSADFNPKIRAQELSVEDWLKLLSDFS